MAYQASKIIVIYLFFTVFSTLLTYTLSVSLGHIGAFLPYLGYIGDQPPESTVFTQCYVIDAAFLMMVFQIQYVYVSFRLAKMGASREVFMANTTGVYIGYVAAMGLFVHACFQESHAYYVHHLGEFVYLLGSALYFACQTVTSRMQNDEAKVRMVLNFFMWMFFVVFLVGYVFAVRRFEKPWELRYYWGKDDGGWIPYLLSSAAEWMLFTLFQCYMLTFSKDFRRVLLTNTRIIVLLNEDEEINQRPAIS